MDKETIARIAKLSHLRFTDAECAAFAGDLSSILNYVSELNAADTAGVAVTVRAGELVNVFREDVPTHGKDLARAAELVNAAPDAEAGYVKVKAIL
ncbi:hypothetical protein A2Z10_02360 [Candidatus Azambacteria bacterium RBG_16_47_10]|uniref:Aspartyl/glutamyl-tRNA(Asn/Gln) amidotransferase subunit C n=1 Tax=Candidatus Azambacteria bacterium RBG_16_47_10 TaxID=1797292 RepID=A0A1F5AZY7_9BACT|nr:MAG: hypothetical protein A2Z10_02360 [Candidatus Azambacteria bacterium RBG_16_47_10]